MRNFTYTGGEGGFTPPPPSGNPPFTVIHAWVGAVNDDGATVKFRSLDAVGAELLVSTSPTLSGPLSFTATEGADDVWTAVATGLVADTQYYFGFDSADLTGQFRTWAPAGDAFSYLVAAGGDTGNSPTYPGLTGSLSNTPAWDRIREHDPLFMLFLGDLHYRNTTSALVSVRRQNLKDCLASARLSQLVREVPTCYLWDDHDYGANDSSGSGASGTGKPAVAQAYREYVPHWPLEEATGPIYHTFVCGRVRFINLDVRYERTPNSATDNSSKTRLGATQKAWLKAELLAATEPLIVLNVMSWWGVTTSFSDGWQSFTTERQELAEFFEDNGLTSRLLLIGADIHELAFDDGTNTQFDPGAATPGPPYVQFAPMDCSFNHFSATYQQRWQTRKQQYGTLEIIDGDPDITARIRLYALSSSPGATSSQQFTTDLLYPG